MTGDAEKKAAAGTEKPRGLVALFERIENPALRRALAVVGLFFLSLAIGHVCEKLFDRHAIDKAYAAQAVWLQKMRAMAPLTLVKGYFADFGPAGAGDWIYHAPPTPPVLTPLERYQISREAGAQLACDLARIGGGVACEQFYRQGLSASVCIADPERQGCAEFNACEAEAVKKITATPPECVGLRPSLSFRDILGTATTPTAPRVQPSSGHKVHALFVPLGALVRTMTRLFAGGMWGFSLAGLQLVMGFLGLRLIGRWLKFSGDDLNPLMTGLLIVPVGSVAVGSFVALGMKWLMLGAGYAFHGVTGLAAAAAGAGGAAGFCWLCFKKLTEQGAEALISGK